MTTPLDQSFRVDQPRPFDLVGDPVLVAGSGGGFEGTIDVRIRLRRGAIVTESFVSTSNLTSAWQTAVDLPGSLTATRGIVEVGPSTGADEHPGLVSVPVVFGTRVVAGFRSYFHYTVQPGDTLASIAADQAPLYTGSGTDPIVQANRHLIRDPDDIAPGIVLRLPSDL